MERGADEADAISKRAAARRANAWVRIVSRDAAEEDDVDDRASTASERVALVDTLMLLAIRSEVGDESERRLQRSVARAFKRQR